MADIDRPAFTESIAALMPDVDLSLGLQNVARWLQESPAEAVEALATAGLWPWEIGDEMAPRWWCEATATRQGCDGTGVRFAHPGWGAPPCGLCDGLGHTADPPSHTALVAVASLGAPMLQRITHTLAREIASAAGCPDARVVWRVMGREEIEGHHRRSGRRNTSSEWSLPSAFSRAASSADGWPVSCAEALPRRRRGRSAASAMLGDGVWTSADADTAKARDASDVAAIHAAWPALRALAVGDGATPQPTGVHLLALNASRIVLAVEAIGGDR